MSLLQKFVDATSKPARGTVARGLYEIEQAGGMDGKTELDWVKAMGGNPQSIHAMPGNQRLLQWTSGRYDIQRIAVMFDHTNHFVQVMSRYQV